MITKYHHPRNELHDSVMEWEYFLHVFTINFDNAVITIHPKTIYISVNFVNAKHEWGIPNHVGKPAGLDAINRRKTFSKASQQALTIPRIAIQYPILIQMLPSLNLRVNNKAILKKDIPYPNMKK